MLYRSEPNSGRSEPERTQHRVVLSSGGDGEPDKPALRAELMSTLRIRSALRPPRRRLAIVLAVLVLGGIVASHHVEPSGMDSGMAAGAVCVAVLGIGSALLAAETMPRWLPRFEPLPHSRPQRELWTSPVRGVPARAGPSYLELSVLRR